MHTMADGVRMRKKAGIKKIIKSFVRCLSKKFKQNENAEHYGEIKVFRSPTPQDEDGNKKKTKKPPS